MWNCVHCSCLSLSLSLWLTSIVVLNRLESIKQWHSILWLQLSQIVLSPLRHAADSARNLVLLSTQYSQWLIIFPPFQNLVSHLFVTLYVHIATTFFVIVSSTYGIVFPRVTVTLKRFKSLALNLLSCANPNVIIILTVFKFAICNLYFLLYFIASLWVLLALVPWTTIYLCVLLSINKQTNLQRFISKLSTTAYTIGCTSLSSLKTWLL